MRKIWQRINQLSLILNFITSRYIMEKKNELLRALPKVDDTMAMLRIEFPEKIPTELLKKIVRRCVENERAKILYDSEKYIQLNDDDWKKFFITQVKKGLRFNLRRVINGTGVVIHTNLGRSLLAESAAAQIVQCSKHYSNLEFNLDNGKRGSRYSLVEEIICDLTGAEAALVVNNNAAAVFLVLETLAHGKEAIVSRGELVEIGGSFRIPDVMAKSGATLVEVGATNRTHYYDYEGGITENTSLLLKVHTSNFRMVGFTSEVSTEDLAALAQKHDLMVMEDLGSGCLLDLSEYGLPKEKTVQEVVNAGADIVTFSGDKLLGGPQAGIIVGKNDVIQRVKKNPLNRALRIDKFTLASLESSLRNYYDRHDALENIPTLTMLTVSPQVIKKRAQRALRQIRKKGIRNCSLSLQTTVSQTGGGAIPEYGLASWALAIVPENITLNRFETDLRDSDLPLIGRIENDTFIIDFRTILDSDVADLTVLLCDYFSS